MQTWACAPKHTHIHIHLHTHITQTYTHTYIHIHRTHIHLHSHTHTLTHSIHSYIHIYSHNIHTHSHSLTYTHHIYVLLSLLMTVTCSLYFLPSFLVLYCNSSLWEFTQIVMSLEFWWEFGMSKILATTFLLASYRCLLGIYLGM